MQSKGSPGAPGNILQDKLAEESLAKKEKGPIGRGARQSMSNGEARRWHGATASLGATSERYHCSRECAIN